MSKKEKMVMAKAKGKRLLNIIVSSIVAPDGVAGHVISGGAEELISLAWILRNAYNLNNYFLRGVPVRNLSGQYEQCVLPCKLSSVLHFIVVIVNHCVLTVLFMNDASVQDVIDRMPSETGSDNRHFKGSFLFAGSSEPDRYSPEGLERVKRFETFSTQLDRFEGCLIKEFLCFNVV